MTYCIEPFIQDLVWCWLEEQEQYRQVGCEVGVGKGVNSGRIDLVGETSGGEYHGFEIKNNSFADEQVNRYLNSKYLDKIYHCSRVGRSVAERLDNKNVTGGGLYSYQRIRKEISNAIAAGQYTRDQYKDALKESFPDTVLNQSVASKSQLNDRILSESEKMVWHRLTKNIGIPTADFDPNADYINLAEALIRIRNDLLVPSEMGVVNVPLEIETNEEIENPEEFDGFRQQLDRPVEESFSKDKYKQVAVVRGADRLEREYTPELSRENEAWVQHYIWLTHGAIREAVLPSQKDDSEYLIDVMGLVGASTPAEVYQNTDSTDLIGIEAKEAQAVSGETNMEKVRDQLERYRDTGVVTKLYLGVPKSAIEDGMRVVETDALDGVGLMSVAKSGDVAVVTEATSVEMMYDGYIKESGTHEYTRSIGFGSVCPPEEPKHANPCRVS